MGFIQNTTTTLTRNTFDAAGYLPTSTPIIVGDYKQDKDNLPLRIDRVYSGSIPVWTAGEVNMPVIAGEYSIAQTKVCHPYVSAHPSVYTITFANFQTEANITKRVGCWRSSTVAPYTANFDGIYLESDGLTYNICIRKNGAVVATIPRASWDDQLNGSGASGINYDFSKFTILQIDFLYLGGSWVRFALNIGGTIVYFHTYKHSGTATSTFCNSPYFYIRWEIRSTGAGVGSLKQICAGQAVLGGVESVGKEFAIDTGVNFINANVVGTEYLICAIRLKSTAQNAFVLPRAISTMAITNDNYLIKMRINPTIAGIVTWTALADSSCDFAVGTVAGTNTITATATPLSSYYALQNQEQLIQRSFLATVGASIAGVSDILTISVIPLSANLDIYASLNLIEI